MKNLLDKLAKCSEENNYSVYRIAAMDGDTGETEQIELRKMNACMNSYSVAKAYTMTAIGMLVDDKLLSLDEKITDILAGDYTDIADDRWHQVTVDMALTHRIGLPKNFLDIDAKDPMDFGEDYLAYILQQTLEVDPGTEYIYTDAAYYLLALVVEKRTDMSLDTFLWKRLFTPLGFREVAWSRCPKGHAMGATGLYVRTDDMVKLGVLYLNGGKWNGQQIVSEEWVQTALTHEYEFHKTGYGESYGKGGMLGQMLLVVPEKRLAVAWHGYGVKAVELTRVAALD
ncbi:MAG: beta-lactamase family protein [Lachnospiraceae bacterium]|nr:beta-lactamase family protein [Lachnospiraceae bacterium]